MDEFRVNVPLIGESAIIAALGCITFSFLSHTSAYSFVAADVCAQFLEESDDEGSALIFLPGAGEIRDCHGVLVGDGRMRGVKVLMLHSNVSASQQVRATEERSDDAARSTSPSDHALGFGGVPPAFLTSRKPH